MEVGVALRRGGQRSVAPPTLVPATLRPTEVEARRSASRWSGAAFQRRVLGFADSACATVAIVAVFSLLSKPSLALGLACAPLALSLFKLAGLYDRDELRLAPSTLDEVPRLLAMTGLVVLALVIVQPALLSRGVTGFQIALLWLTSFATITSGRAMARSITGRTQAVERCLVIGDLEQARRVRDRLTASGARAEVVTCLPLAGDDLDDELEIPLFVSQLILEQHIDRVIIAPAAEDATGGVELIRMVKAAGVDVSVLPRIFDVLGSEVEFDEVDGLTLLGVRRFGLRRSSRLVKRSFDLVVASAGLIACGPFLLAIALAIRFDSKGPVLFRQLRVGRDGKYFEMVKFRSMISGADALKEGLRAKSEPGDGLFKIVDDPRVTSIGRLLRRSSLDELPQIFNVLRGEMSLVGPRPLVADEDERIVGFARSRLHLTPGMTGPWQVIGVRLPLDEMIEIDYRYVSNWSLWLDLKLLLRTVPHVLRRGNV
ncbi:MAG TPA: exopolysaccharide biosynthesis polyprenyl glycosylphosphotransferase [Solirubrobacteraceae bacterium]|nr:exopolysaccharide biosynthesis polyprenyl glycosylphosphotransferase [Solirubrobacteraceae bacterium]